MGVLLGILLGLAIGAAAVYFLLSRQVAEQGTAIQALRQQLTQADAERDRRLKAVTESLRQSHEIQLAEAHAKTQTIQQRLTATETERDRLKYDYDANVRAVHADAARQVQQKLAEAEAEFNRRLQTERDRLQQEYETQLAAAQPYTAQSGAAQPMASLMPPIPTVLDTPEPMPLPLSESSEPSPVITSAISSGTPVETLGATILTSSGTMDLDTSLDLRPDIAAASTLAQEPMVSPGPSESDPSKLSSHSWHQQAMPASASTVGMPAQSGNALTQNANALMLDSYASEATKRCHVANAIATAMPAATAADQARWLPTLKRLIRDGDPTVRVQAINALSHAKQTTYSLPLLRRALRDAHPSVVEAASTAISRFKGSAPRARHTPPKPRLPKNR